MLTSLLSFYIAATLSGDIAQTSPHKIASTTFLNKISEQNIKPEKDPHFVSPIIGARGVISMDLETEEILHGKNIHTRMPIASITKLMTILIVLEENELDEIVTVSNNAAGTGGSTMHLRAGERITVRNLLYGAIITSANDAAVALAEHNAGNISAFVTKMNKTASEMGLVNTRFQNPIGFDDLLNYSSPYDVAKLAKTVYKNEFVKEAAVIRNKVVRSVNGAHTHRLESTNDLLGSYLNVKGLKTGRTSAAGLCLVAIAENNEGNKIIAVVLNSPARFKESKILIDWTFRAYNWI